MSEPASACICAAVRTPIGRYGGVLSDVRPDDLAAHVMRRLVEDSDIEPREVEDVYFGCGNQAGEDNRNIARMGLLLAGFPDEVAGCTVNRLCASGMEAVISAARAVGAGDLEVCVAGGVESMTRAPWAMAKPRRGSPRGNSVAHDTALGWRFVNPRMDELGHTDSLGETAENVATEYRIERQVQDEFAFGSHRKALAADRAGRLDRELVSVPVNGAVVERDEGPRPDSSIEKLAALRPVFRDGGSVTAGNSSPLSDGAAALLIASEDYARQSGLPIMARVAASAVAGVAPRVMGIGPVPATHKALKHAGLTTADLDLIEINEAFASQAVASLRQLGVDEADDRVNPNGGAVALGHPIGCSGARLVGTLAHELNARDLESGLATMCVGVGQGVAVVLRNGPCRD